MNNVQSVALSLAGLAPTIIMKAVDNVIGAVVAPSGGLFALGAGVPASIANSFPRAFFIAGGNSLAPANSARAARMRHVMAVAAWIATNAGAAALAEEGADAGARDGSILADRYYHNRVFQGIEPGAARKVYVGLAVGL